jgi:outer membrane protein assembly factor BamB
MRHVLSLLLLTIAALALGCASSSSHWRTADDSSWITPADTARLGYRAAWPASLHVKSRQHLVDAAILGDAVVTIEAPDRVISAVSLRDGALRWRTAVGTAAQSLVGLTMVNGRVAANTQTQLYLLDADSGEVKTIQNLARPVNTRPVPFNNLLIFGAIDGVVMAHNTESGLPVWEYQLANQIAFSPVLAGNSVFAADLSGTYAMLTAGKGELIWRGRTFGAIAAAAADSNAVYVPSADQAMYALLRTTGRDRWQPFRSDRALIDPPHVLDNTIYLPIPDTALIAVDAVSGQVLWKLPRNVWAVDLRGHTLLLRTPQSLLTAAPATGTIHQEVNISDLAFVLPTREGALILISNAGRLLRLDPLP